MIPPLGGLLQAEETHNEKTVSDPCLSLAVCCCGCRAGALYGGSGLARDIGQSQACANGCLSNQPSPSIEAAARRAEAPGAHHGLQGFSQGDAGRPARLGPCPSGSV